MTPIRCTVAYPDPREPDSKKPDVWSIDGPSPYGGPGLRPDYHPHYYGAFVIDPEGNNIEAVGHWPE